MGDMLPTKLEDVKQGVERGRPRPRGTTLDVGQRPSRDTGTCSDLGLSPECRTLQLALAMTLQEPTKIGPQPDSASRQQHAAGTIRLGHRATPIRGLNS
ncbi:hypothetical protein QTN93_00840 [Sphingomonas aerolata]